MTIKPHRNKSAYPVLWAAVDGAIRSAQNAHHEIQIPNRASIVKRVVGQVLANEVRSTLVDEKSQLSTSGESEADGVTPITPSEGGPNTSPPSITPAEAATAWKCINLVLQKRVKAADDMAARAENVFRSEYHNTNHIEGAKQYFNANMEALAAYRAAGGQDNE